jgi:hypothetical protein
MPPHVVLALLYMTHAAAPHMLSLVHCEAQNSLPFESVKQQYPEPQMLVLQPL